MRRIWLLLVGLLVVIFPVIASAQDFCLHDPMAVQVNGEAMVAGHAIALMQGQLNGRASAFTMSRVQVDRDFWIEANILLGPAGTRYIADGIAICLQTQGPGALGALGGEGMGFYGIRNYVCVALNNYVSDSGGPRQASLGAIYETGQRPVGDGSGETPLAVSLSDNRAKYVLVGYSYTDKILSVTIIDTRTGAWDSFSGRKDLAAALGATSAYLGATAGTGTFSEEALVLSLAYY